MFKHVQHERRMWQWPKDDKKLLLVNDYVNDFHSVMSRQITTRGGTAIQAGGAVGLWPFAMSKYFAHVYTFEPHRENFTCLVNNVYDQINIYPIWGALGAGHGWCSLHLHESEQNNAGAYYTNNDGGDVPVFMIDQFGFKDVEFIQLDVEGAERMALKGAAATIDAYAPVVMLESKKLPQMTEHESGAVKHMNSRHGYEVIMKLHRDVVMVKKT